MADRPEPNDEYVPVVVPIRDPGPPPRIPLLRRAGRTALRLWPFLAWCGALAVGLWLYFGEAWHGHALAFADILEFRVAPAVPGRLATLAADVGQEVREGDLVATLDPRDLEERIRLAKAEVERLRARIGAEREILRLEEIDRRAQEAARQRAYESEAQRLRSEADKLSTERSADQAELEALKPQTDRLRPLVEKRLVTADRLEELVQRQAMLEKRMAGRDLALQEVRRQVSAWTTLAPAKLPDFALDVRLLPFESELKAAELRLAELELERTKYGINAPASGRVHVITTRPGEWVQAGGEIFKIVTARPGRLTCYVTDRQIPIVTVGTRATLRPRGRSGAPLEGRVTIAGPEIEQIPQRLRFIPTVPQWGRLVTLQVEKAGALLPGDIYDVRFHQ